MPTPSFVFSFILATLFGSGFHLLFGGDARRLALFLLTGWIGFGVGHIVGVAFEIDIFSVGALRLVSACVGAIVALGTVQILTAGQTRRRL